DDVHIVSDHLAANHYDVLINNAGVGMYGRFEELAMPEQAAMMNLNMTALTKLSLTYLQHARKGDTLVNVASVLGTTACPGSAVYAGTKAYVTIFTESLWWENKDRGVYVMAFCPGVTQTAFHTISGGSDGMFPNAITQTPVQVAKELVRAIEKRSKPKVISGAMNRMMVFFQRLMSRKMMVGIMGSTGPLSAMKPATLSPTRN
ncbi:MAG: putative oxidoreductase, family, partial [Bacteroidetes bacterium]|nr:putative oxidoreductase, family [Bacteroidota bacterium]